MVVVVVSDGVVVDVLVDAVELVAPVEFVVVVPPPATVTVRLSRLMYWLEPAVPSNHTLSVCDAGGEGRVECDGGPGAPVRGRGERLVGGDHRAVELDLAAGDAVARAVTQGER